jgi:hypothetical protein
MGYRTVVVFYNDQANEWSNCADLGQRIAAAMNQCTDTTNDGGNLHCGGRVVECTHADTQTLAVLDGYDFKPVVHESWVRNENWLDLPLKLVKAAAKKLGYRLVKAE